MKNTLLVIAMLLVSLTGFAKDKQYPFTGNATFEAFDSNAEAHVDLGNGETADAYCDVNSTSVTCHDHAGVFYVTLADGKKYTYFAAIARSHGIVQPTLPKTFQYRPTTEWGNTTPDMSKAKYICVSFDDSGKQKEACYSITLSVSYNAQP